MAKNRSSKPLVKAVAATTLTATPNTSSIDLTKSTDVATELQALHNLNSYAQAKIASQNFDLQRFNEIVDAIQKELSTFPPKMTWWWVVTHVEEITSFVKYVIALIRQRPSNGV